MIEPRAAAASPAPLSDRLAGGPLDVASFFRLAGHACARLAELHRRGAVHGHINPRAIMASADYREVQLTEFNLAAGPSQELRVTSPVGVAAYMPPEQTGRINRSIDYRTDFYALGATFYECLTGAPPFSSDDPLELIHAHLARTPVRPSDVNPRVPEQVSRIVMRLLAKSAEDRYQSAFGIGRDLAMCAQEWEAGGAITAFELGRSDVSEQFLVSQKLYGRQAEAQSMARAFDGACAGRTALMLVSGYSGVGKTSLVTDLCRPIVLGRGYFVTGKFDQVVRNIPYDALAQALRRLIRQLLTETEEELTGWRVRLGEALGANGGVLAEVMPEIELILGRQPAPAPLEPTEARNRFGYVFQRFVGALARPDRPLVVFLDDLQWVDAATIDLLHTLLTAPDIRHLLLIGAYRDNEVDADHLLTWSIQRLEAAGADVHRIAVPPLARADLRLFLRDTLHGEAAELEPLADLIHHKTDGNPFFVIQFLRALEQERLLTFDRDRRKWTFRLDAIAAAGMTDNVIDLMTRKIRRTSAAAQRVLTVAACIGNRFDVATFQAVSRQPSAEADDGLTEALDAGLVRALRDRTVFTFLHDRVQQAAYALISDSDRQAIHRDLGRLLLAGGAVDAAAADDRLFETANHLNMGRDLIAEPNERLAVARLNLAAGRKAKTSAAYRAACGYLEAGIGLLGGEWTAPPSDEPAASPWPADHPVYDLALALHLEVAECQYLSGDFARAEQSFRPLLDRVTVPLDRAQIHTLRITLYENQSRWAEAVESGRDALALFGLSLPETGEAAQAALDREVEAVQQLLGDRPIASLSALPAMTDARVITMMRTLTTLWAPAYISGNERLARLISAILVRLSLLHGNTADSAYGYVTHAITIGPGRQDYASAYEWGLLALTVNDRFDDVKRRAKIHQQFQAHVNLWRRPFSTCLPHAREARRIGLETGDFTYAGYGAATEAWAAFLVARDLDRFERDFTPTLSLLQTVKMADFAAAHRVVLNWARALQGRTSTPLSLSDETFDEEAFVDTYEQAAPFFLMFFYAAKLHLSVLLDDITGARAIAGRARAVTVGGTLWPVLLDFWGALAAARAHATAGPGERAALREEVEAACERLRTLADNCPENFRCRWLLLAAESARLASRDAEAARLSEEALGYARQTDDLQHEALAGELCATAWLAQGRDAIAAAFLSDARRAYEAWGAEPKVRQLEAAYPRLLPPSHRLAPAAATQPPALHAPAALDMSTVVKVARAISVEIELDGLLRKLMKIALENAGADRGLFLGERGGTLTIEAEASTTPDRVTVGPPAAFDRESRLATSVVRYVHRTGQDLVVDEAPADERFASDEYVRRAGLRSILCVPVNHQGRTIGILYLENSLTARAFTPGRIEMMRILTGQAAISLENARLYAGMKAEVDRRTVAEQALREALTQLEGLKTRLETENVYLQEEIRTQHNFNEIVGNSPALLDALHKVARVAPTDATVLIVGETGSGKELFARAVHSRSQRSSRPLVKVNCGAIAPGLVESELFGHVRGAFTGAVERRVGRFEVADGGTIFLDEVGDLPLDAQVKLLRVLQEREFEAVGSSRTVRVNVRVIAATNRNLQEAVRDGRFRADLLYRLNVFPIEVPPLRRRGSDVQLLAHAFLAAAARKLGKPVQGLSAASLERIAGYTWPGNVRELQNVVERAAILAPGPIVELDDALTGLEPPERGQPIDAAVGTLDDAQRARIIEALRSTGGVVDGARGAASILGLHPNTLRSRMKKLGISASSWRAS